MFICQLLQNCLLIYISELPCRGNIKTAAVHSLPHWSEYSCITMLPFTSHSPPLPPKCWHYRYVQPLLVYAEALCVLGRHSPVSLAQVLSFTLASLCLEPSRCFAIINWLLFQPGNSALWLKYRHIICNAKAIKFAKSRAKGFDSDYYYSIRFCIWISLIFTLLLMAGARGHEEDITIFFFSEGKAVVTCVNGLFTIKQWNIPL